MAKSKITPPDEKKVKESPNQPLAKWPQFLSHPHWLAVGIGAVAALVYLQSLFFGFVMDDAIVITDNMFTQQGLGGIKGILTKDTFYGFFKEAGKETVVSGGRYRPFTLVVFAVMYSIFGKAAMPYHLLTVIAYAGTCVLLFYTVRKLLARTGEEATPRVNFIAALTGLLFAVHPVHVEVVANIKGCDEIFSLLGSLAALYLTLKAYDTKKMQYALLAGLVFLMGVFSKENAFVFIALIPAALVMLRGARIGEALRFAWPSIVVGLFFFLVRFIILKGEFGSEPLDLMNNPFLKVQGNVWVPFTAAEKFGAIFHTLTLYIKLMLFPHPLTHDYYPRHIEILGFSDPLALLALVLYGGLIYYCFKNWKRDDGSVFGILTFLSTLFIVSNIVFPVGTHMGERFLFMPSMGFLLALSIWLTDYCIKRNRTNALMVGVAIVAVLFALKTVTRVPVWESNDKLFLTDIQTSKRSAKLLNAVGGTLYDQGLLIKDNPSKMEANMRQAIPYLNQAIQIHPTYKSAFLLRANCLFYLKQYDDAIRDYKEAIRIDEGFKDARTNLSICLREAGKNAGEKEGNVAKALQYLNESFQLNQKDPETLRLLGVANGVGGQHQVALDWFIKALALDPSNPRLLYDLGTAYYSVGDLARAQEYRQKAEQIDPNINKPK